LTGPALTPQCDMSFDAPVYYVFLAIVVMVYWRLPWRAQNWLLLVASYFFYGWWDWRFLFLIATSTVMDFWLADVIASSRNPGQRRSCLAVSLVLNFGFLGFFKYFNFFVGSFRELMESLGLGTVTGPVLDIILPAGISFYTFQAVAYIVDVYRRKIEPCRDFVSYALFISFFPHLVAGPIQCPAHLLPQTSSPRCYAPGRVFDGLMLIVTGLFRKCVIADNCALLANAAFSGQLGEPSTATVLLGMYAFAGQIYGDFSGYSDIARGSAQLFGFHFNINFRQPYLATCLGEFWRRWHISLSTWLRDYLYIPLGGNRRGERRTYLNLLATMLLGGLWHGANMTFVLWGGIHGVGLAVERWLGIKPRLPRCLAAGEDSKGVPSPAWSLWLRRIVIFHLVCLAWIVFRAASVAESLHYIGGIARWAWQAEYVTAFAFLALFSLPLLLLDLILERRNEEYPGEKWTGAVRFLPYAGRSALAAGLLLMVLVFGAPKSSAFIYFQF